MHTTGQIEIPLSKSKMTLMFIGSLAFVVTGFLLVFSPGITIGGKFYNSTIIFITGIVAILFFGACAIMIFNKLRDNKAGLIINKTGIIDNSSGISAGHIPWTDIIEITTLDIVNQRFLMIVIDNPNHYIQRQKNPLKRKAAEINFKNYGSPISISANALKLNFNELEILLQTQLSNNKLQ